MSFGKKTREQICDYCGVRREKIAFVIGAARTAGDWVIWEGGGRMSCPAQSCYDKGKAESRQIIDRHVEAHNNRASKAVDR